MAKSCKEFMEGFTDANATDKEKLEYAQCVNDNVYIVNSHSVYDNQPLMFGIIFVIILLVAFALGTYIRHTKRNNS